MPLVVNKVPRVRLAYAQRNHQIRVANVRCTAANATTDSIFPLLYLVATSNFCCRSRSWRLDVWMSIYQRFQNFRCESTVTLTHSVSANLARSAGRAAARTA
eukprot:1832649-Rhodomonas_salina.3